MIDQQDTMVLTVDSEDGLTYSCVLESDDDESDEASTTSKGTIDQSALGLVRFCRIAPGIVPLKASLVSRVSAHSRPCSGWNK